MRAFTVYFSFKRDLTSVKLSTQFEDENWITKADILKDAIADLQELYEKTLTESKK